VFESIDRRPLRAVFAAVLLLGGGSSSAQALYRIVGPDGRVTYSDVPHPPRPRLPRSRLERVRRQRVQALPFPMNCSKS
jgi:hypothetical protein